MGLGTACAGMEGENSIVAVILTPQQSGQPCFFHLVGQPLKWALLVLTILTFVGHRENIKRLLQGKENKITPKKKA